MSNLSGKERLDRIKLYNDSTCNFARSLSSAITGPILCIGVIGLGFAYLEMKSDESKNYLAAANQNAQNNINNGEANTNNIIASNMSYNDLSKCILLQNVDTMEYCIANKVQDYKIEENTASPVVIYVDVVNNKELFKVDLNNTDSDTINNYNEVDTMENVLLSNNLLKADYSNDDIKDIINMISKKLAKDSEKNEKTKVKGK